MTTEELKEWLAIKCSERIDRLTAQLAAAVQRAERAEGERDAYALAVKATWEERDRLREENERLRSACNRH
jgi:Arc/MetJ family transcription regulator